MGTLQVGGTTLGVKNTSTNKIDLSNLGEVGSITGGNFGTITERTTSNISGLTFSQTDGSTVDTTNLFGSSSNIKPNGTTNATHSWIAWDYGSGNAKKINKVQWETEDGSANSNGTFFEGSNVASPNASAGHSDWTQLASIGNLVNHAIQSYSAPANQTTKYRHYRIRWSWSSANYVSLYNFILEDTDSTFDARTALNATGDAPIYACRAWVNFDGTGTVAIRASANVSSITDIADGKYTVNLTTAIEDSNYCVTGAVRKNNTTDDGNMVLTLGATDTTYSTTAFRVTTRQSASNGVRNAELVCCAVFR